MSRPAVLAFACLACFLILLPLTLKKPGLPMRLSGDEATYLAMATSLGMDGDVRCEGTDLRRLFAEFPFAEARLELVTDDGWATARFARPIVYSLVSAPLVALWGANGPLALNAACFALALAFGWLRLRRANGAGVALVFVLGFFLFSAAYSYLFRVQPQVMVMAAVTVALALGWKDPRRPRTSASRWWLSGIALGVAALQEPMLLLLAVPLLAGLVTSRRRDAMRWLAGCGLTLALGALVSIALTGGVGVDHLHRTGTVATFTLDDPLELPWQDPEAIEGARAGDGARRSAMNLLEEAALLLWGRRHGVLPYFPLMLPILVLFGAGGGRSRREWLLLATVTGLGILQLIAEPLSRGLHQAQVGNPHMVGVYPAFLFLVSRLRRAVVVAGYGLGTLMMGSLMLTTLGSVVPQAADHAHTRSFPYPWLPLEVPALDSLSGYREVELHGLEAAGKPSALRLRAPADQVQVRGEELWLLGGESVELWLESRAELPTAVLQLRNLAPGNRIDLKFGSQHERRDFDQVPPEGIGFRLELEPRNPDRVRRDGAGVVNYYRLRVKTRHGEKPRWRHGVAAKEYLGVAVSFLGSREFLARDLYAADWLGCGAPTSVAPEEIFLTAARLRNASQHSWNHRGPARVRLSYRWLDAAGKEIPGTGERTDLQAAVEPGQDVASWVSVRAPRAPGRYLLELDPLFENVAWFSSRDPEATCRAEVEVAPP